MNKPSSIGSTYAPDIVNKLSSYCELIGVDRTKLVSNLIVKALEGRILTNDFINLDKPYYFDFKKLIHEGTIEATNKKPIIEAERIYILKKVPNNLDKRTKMFCNIIRDADKIDIIIETYPSFPTDLQQILTTVLLNCGGKIKDLIFPNRIAHIEQLRKINS